MIIINNKKYNGNSVIISNNKIIIDGKEIIEELKEINITIQGDIKELKVDSCNYCEITGNVNSVSTMSGNVKYKNVNGSISTMSGDIYKN